MNKKSIVHLSTRQILRPFSVEESLAFECPQENVGAFGEPIVAQVRHSMTTGCESPFANGPNVMPTLACTMDKPQTLGGEHPRVNSQQQSGGFVPMSGVEIPTGLDEHSVAQYDRKVLNNGPTLHVPVCLPGRSESGVRVR
jgi:hypothetical protein